MYTRHQVLHSYQKTMKKSMTDYICYFVKISKKHVSLIVHSVHALLGTVHSRNVFKTCKTLFGAAGEEGMGLVDRCRGCCSARALHQQLRGRRW